VNSTHQEYIAQKFSKRVLINQSMKKHSTFGIGGKAKVLFLPKQRLEIKEMLKYSMKNNINIMFIGSGSNLLISDKGFDGILISLKRAFKHIEFSDNGDIVAGAGVMLGRMVNQAIRRKFKGLESLVGVPGTLGGALFMNAGAYGTEISKCFVSAKLMNMAGDEIEVLKESVGFSYRASEFPEDCLLLEARFKCEIGDIDKIKKNKATFSLSRKTNQPLSFRSAGSIFKNPSNDLAAGYLIDKAGLKGVCKGGAMISDKHANFIVNLGSAKSSDVIYLIKLIREKVLSDFDVLLKLEIKLIGFKKEILNDLD
tara:strand:- start:1728 stop:2663 length:936 start_codon:yes stop_codon:yes gene_type:complete